MPESKPDNPQCPITPEENAWLNKLARDICADKVNKHAAYNVLVNVLCYGRAGMPAQGCAGPKEQSKC